MSLLIPFLSTKQAAFIINSTSMIGVTSWNVGTLSVACKCPSVSFVLNEDLLSFVEENAARICMCFRTLPLSHQQQNGHVATFLLEETDKNLGCQCLCIHVSTQCHTATLLIP